MTLVDYKKTCCLSELFHYDLSSRRGGELKKGLEEYKFVLSIAFSAIRHLKNLDLEKFDALVGENACQIRAVKIALIAKTFSLDNIVDLLQQIEVASQAVDQLLTPASINQLMRKGISLKEILEQHNLTIDLTADEMFAIQSYFLSQMRVELSENGVLPSLTLLEICSPLSLQKKAPHISHSFITKLGNHVRKLLSKSSVEFVREVATYLNDPELIEMVSEKFEILHHKLTCIPLFWSVKALFTFALKAKIPVVFHAKLLRSVKDGYEISEEECLYFKPCQTTKTYTAVDVMELDSTTPVCVIEGVLYTDGKDTVISLENWRQALKNRSVLEILLAAAADHRQYPDSNKEILTEIDEYERFKRISREEGFALSNPTVFFVRHIYSTAVQKRASLNKLLKLQAAQLA